MNKLSFRSALALIPTMALICLPLITLAQAPAAYSNNTAPAVTSNNSSGYKLDNPLKVGNFCDLLETLLGAIIVIGMPIAVLFLVYVGFNFILARGNPEKIGKARNNLLYTVIGIAVFLGAWTIAKLIQATLVNLGAGAAKSC